MIKQASKKSKGKALPEGGLGGEMAPAYGGADF